MGTQITPIFYQLDRPIFSDESTQMTNKLIIRPTSGNAGDNLNTSGQQITFIKESDNKNIRLYKSRITALCKFKTRSGTPLVDKEDANITLCMNALDYLFNDIRLRIGNKEVEVLGYPGTCNQILDIINKGKNYSNLSECYVLDEGTGTAADTNNGWKKRKSFYNYDIPNDATYREVELSRPLSSLFGFCEVDRLISYLQIEVVLNRSGTYKNSVFGAADTDIDGSVFLQNITLELYSIVPNLDMSIAYNKMLKAQKKFNWFYQRRVSYKRSITTQNYDVSLGSRKNPPRYVLIVFKDPTKDNSSTSNNALFIHGDIKNCSITLNEVRYPNLDQNAEFKKNKFNAFYQDYVNLSAKFSDAEPPDCDTYKNFYPIFAIDCSDQPPMLKGSSVSISITIQRNSNDPAAIDAYILMLEDNQLQAIVEEGKMIDLIDSS